MTVAAISRCFDALECLAVGWLEFGAIAARTDPPKSVVQRILSTLAERGGVVQDAEPGPRTAIALEARAS
ncbi:MAG: helix-turn-helix domain-containing protein [Betaproteobacteria bacterium]